MNEGWIPIPRAFFKKPLWIGSNSDQKVVLMTIIAMVNHTANKWEWNGLEFDLKAGQTVTSLNSILEETGIKSKRVSVKSVRSAIARFEKLGFLVNESAKTGRLITIVQWPLCETSKSEDGKANGKEGANDGQSDGKEGATIEEGKELKEGNNDKKPKVDFADDSVEIELSRELYLKASKINEAVARRKPDGQKWAKYFDLILRVDKHPIEEVRKVMNWAFTDQFWSAQLQSPKGLRKHYPKILGKMKSITKKDSGYSLAQFESALDRAGQ